MVIFRRALATVLVLLMLWPSLVMAQEKAGVVTTLEGTVTATRATGSPVALKFKDDVFLRDRITTGDRSLARMLLGGKAVVTVRERSVLNITEVPGRSTIDIESGKIALAVAREKLRPGEQIEIRTPNAVAAVRGTVVVAEILRASAQAGAGSPAVTTNFYVLRGTVLASQLDPVTRAPGPQQTLNVLQSFSVTGNAAPRVGAISPEQVRQVTSGLQPQGVQPIEAGNRAQVLEQAMQTATALVTTLVGPTPGAAGLQGEAVVAPTTTTLVTPTTESPTFAPIIPTFQEAVQETTQTSDDFVLSGGSTTLFAAIRRFNTTLNRSSLSPVVQLSDTTLNIVNPDAGALEFVTGGNVTLASPLLTAANSILNLGPELLLVEGGSLTSSATAPAIALSDTTVNVGETLVAVGGQDLNEALVARQVTGDIEGNLLLAGPLMTATHSAIRSEGVVIAIDGGNLRASTPLPLLNFTDSTVSAAGQFLFMDGSDLVLAGPLLADNASTFSTGIPNVRASSFIFADADAFVRSTTTAPLIQFTDTTVQTTGSFFSARSSFTPSEFQFHPQIQLAGSLLSAAGGSITTVSTASFDASGARRLCCSLLAIGQGAQLTATGSDHLLRLTGTTLAVSSVVSLFDFVSLLGEPGVVATPSMSLAGGLLSVTGGSIAALQTVLGVFRGTLSSTTTDYLLAFDNTTVNVGGISPLDGSMTLGRLVQISLSNSTGNTTLSRVNLGGGLWRSTDSTITSTDDAFAILDGSTLISAGAAPLIAISGDSLTATGGNFFVASSAAGNTPVTITLAGPLLSATNTTLRNGDPASNVQSFMFIANGTSLTSTTTLPLMSLSNTTVDTSGSFLTVRNNVNQVNPVLSLAGPLLQATGGLLRARTTALRNAAGDLVLCCNLFSLGQGAQLTPNATAPQISTAPLIQLSGTTLDVNRVVSLFDFTSIQGEPTIVASASMTLAGGLLSATDGSVSALSGVLGIFRSALSSTGTDPLLSFDGTTVTSGGINPLDGSTTLGRLVQVSLSNSTGNTVLSSLSLGGPLWRSTNAIVTSTDDAFGIFDGSTLTSATADPLISVTGGSITATGTGNFFVASSAAGNTPVSITLAGPLLSATNTTLRNGNPAVNAQSFVFLGNGTSFTSTTTSPLMSFDATTVDSSGNILNVRNNVSQANPTMTLAGPLLVATNNSSFNTSSLGFPSGSPSTCCSAFFIAQGARFTGTGTGALIQLTNSTFSAGPDAQSGGSFFSVTDSVAGESIVAAASLTIAGGLLSATSSTITSLFRHLGVDRSSFTSTGTGALITLSGSTLSAGGPNPLAGNATTFAPILDVTGSTTTSSAIASVTLAGPFLSATNSTIAATAHIVRVINGASLTSPTTLPFIALSNSPVSAGSSAFLGGLLSVSGVGGPTGSTPASVTLAGPLLSAIDSTLTFNGNVIGVSTGATVTSTTTSPFITLSNSTLTAGSSSFQGRVLTVSGAGGTTGSAFATVTLAGPLISVASALNATDGLVGVFANGKLQVNTSTDPLASFSGGTHLIATNSSSAMFNLAGRSTATTTEDAGEIPSFETPAVTVTVGTDVPLSHGGVFMDASGATFGSGSTHTQQFYVQDTALVAASLPILRLRNGSALTTALDAIDLTNQAKLMTVGNLMEMVASTLTVNSGAAVRVNNSLLNVGGDVFSLTAGSTLNVNNGAALHISGTAVVNVSGVMYRFGVGTNTVNITNSGCASPGFCVVTGGIRIAFQNGASSNQINVVSGVGGSGTINLGTNSADVILNGGNTRLIINGGGS